MYTILATRISKRGKVTNDYKCTSSYYLATAEDIVKTMNGTDDFGATYENIRIIEE